MSRSKKTRSIKKREQRSANEIPDPQQGWAAHQIGSQNYLMLTICVVAQFATILISWPAWQVRELPPNLPWLESMPQFSCGVMLIVSLIAVLVSPKKFGLMIHLLALLVAITMDQFRCQPQILSVTMLMAGCVWKPFRRIAVWYLVSMWLWAGFNKMISPDWFTHYSYKLLRLLTDDVKDIYVGFAIVVAVSEFSLGVFAWLKPRLAAIGCVALHVGITIFLLMIGWNFSVLPWNICTAIVGSWLLWNFDSPDLLSQFADHNTAPRKRLPFPKVNWERFAVVFLMVVPVGMYFGLVRHCFCHALYSGNLPIALITHHDRVEFVDTWKDLTFPFPGVHSAYRQYFALTAQPGEKLHIGEPLPTMEDHYYVLDQNRKLKELTLDEFFAASGNQVKGMALDDPVKRFRLEIANATLLKRSEFEMIYAVKFDAHRFRASCLPLLDGLPNLEQLQLGNCLVSDEDLKAIRGFKKLVAIGLTNTSVSDAGLEHLKTNLNLIVVEQEGTKITPEGLKRIGIEEEN